MKVLCWNGFRMLGILAVAFLLISCSSTWKAHDGKDIKQQYLGIVDRCDYWNSYVSRVKAHLLANDESRTFDIVTWVTERRIRIDVVSRWGGTVAVGMFDEGGNNQVWFPSRNEVYVAEDGGYLVHSLIGLYIPPQKIREVFSGCINGNIVNKGGSDLVDEVMLGDEYNTKVTYDPPLDVTVVREHPKNIFIQTNNGVILRLSVKSMERDVNISNTIFTPSIPKDASIIRL